MAVFDLNCLVCHEKRSAPQVGLGTGRKQLLIVEKNKLHRPCIHPFTALGISHHLCCELRYADDPERLVRIIAVIGAQLVHDAEAARQHHKHLDLPLLSHVRCWNNLPRI
eukprot:4170218-Pyramimonas_sp.AAC.2